MTQAQAYMILAVLWMIFAQREKGWVEVAAFIAALAAWGAAVFS